MGGMRVVHRLSGNRFGGNPVAYLTTVGARSGQQRKSALMVFADGDDAWLIVASRAGSADHPAWFYNLAKSPEGELEVGGRKVAVTAETLSGEERTTAWERVSREQPRYADYQQKTDRELPVLRLRTR
jgi:deazaflavin-dependent oxidoreductase (nitroreductase family)